MPRYVGPTMKYVPFISIDKEKQTINLQYMDKSFNTHFVQEIKPIPLLFQPIIAPKDVTVASNADYHKLKMCQSSNVRFDGTQDLVVFLRLNDHIIIIEEYRVHYEKKTAVLIGMQLYFTTTAISDNGWKVLPQFENKHSKAIQGYIIYHKMEKWEKLCILHNFQKTDYIMINELGSAGYILEEESLLLAVGLNTSFSLKHDMSHKEQRLTIDRIMKTLSNLTPNTTFLSPKDYLNEIL